jgi:hypothetical protein
VLDDDANDADASGRAAPYDDDAPSSPHGDAPPRLRARPSHATRDADVDGDEVLEPERQPRALGVDDDERPSRLGGAGGAARSR